MSRMVVGSEGTLCVVTEAKVNLVPVPRHKGLGVVHFDDVVEACEATWEILRHNPAAVEMIGRMILDRCRESLGSARLMDFVEGLPTLFWSSNSPASPRKRSSPSWENYAPTWSRKGWVHLPEHFGALGTSQSLGAEKLRARPADERKRRLETTGLR